MSKELDQLIEKYEGKASKEYDPQNEAQAMYHKMSDIFLIELKLLQESVTDFPRSAATRIAILMFGLGFSIGALLILLSRVV